MTSAPIPSNESPSRILPLSDGVFTFDGIEKRVWSETLGHVDISSGKLLIGDPFLGLHRRGNVGLAITPGRYRVAQTLMGTSDQKPKPIFLSIVMAEDLLEQRKTWQVRRLDAYADAGLPGHALSQLGEDGLAIECRSGSMAMVDQDIFEQDMPGDHDSPGNNWYDTLFEHGVPGSWFGQMDASHPSREGSALIDLPGNPSRGKIAIAQSGNGAGLYRVFLEHAFYDAVWPENEQNDDAIVIEVIDRMAPVIAMHIQM